MRTFTHTLATTLLLVLSPLALPQAAPAPPSEPKTFTSAAEIAALIAKADGDHKAGLPVAMVQLLRLAPYLGNFDYRTAPSDAAIHDREAEVFVVLEGSGTLMIGGTLAGKVEHRGENLIAKSSEGGTAQKIAKGDVLIVAEKTAHWISAVDGKLVMMTLHVPRPVPGG